MCFFINHISKCSGTPPTSTPILFDQSLSYPQLVNLSKRLRVSNCKESRFSKFSSCLLMFFVIERVKEGKKYKYQKYKQRNRMHDYMLQRTQENSLKRHGRGILTPRPPRISSEWRRLILQINKKTAMKRVLACYRH